MKRRQFLLGTILSRGLFSETRGFDVEIMEVFAVSGGGSALLVHHGDTASRAEFARWLHVHNRSEVRCQLPHGRTVRGQIFRLKMCFGRGLLLTGERVDVQPKGKIRIEIE
ncbi:MAG TPA: hypothetical protein VGQ81_00880 [Acidobacteriota bacterium]|jgi:hypothetical protein|nr:hypothetical protein [Acidobacteriota bacterium]